MKGKKILITGASGGVGSAAAIALSKLGAECTLLVRTLAKGEAVVAQMDRSLYQPSICTTHAVRDDFGCFDGVLHTAGVEAVRPLNMPYDEKAEEVMRSSFEFAVSILRETSYRVKPLVGSGGSIVMMSSVAAVCGQAGMSLYCASKGAIEALSRAAAMELAPRRIRVNCIRAGAFSSPMHQRLAKNMSGDTLKDYEARHPLGFGTVDDVVEAALFLLSDRSKWITGTALTVDGGYSAR